MSQDNVEAMRRAFQALNRVDVEDALSYYHPDVEVRDLYHLPDLPACVRGTDALRVIWKGWQAAFGGLRADVEEFIDAGDAVVCVTHWYAAESAKGGISLDQTFAEVFEFEGGLVIPATRGYSSRSDALKAVGVEE